MALGLLEGVAGCNGLESTFFPPSPRPSPTRGEGDLRLPPSRQRRLFAASCHRNREKEFIAATRASLTLIPVSVGKPDTTSVVRLRSPDGWEIELPGNSVPLLVDFLKHLS